MAVRPIGIAPLLVALAALVACTDTDAGEAAGSTALPVAIATSTVSTIADEQRYPDVIGAEAELAGDGTWTVSATISSPYDTPERYADAWRVLGPDGAEYGIRVLTHDHANEQPFTRSQRGIEIPAEVDVVTVEGRDLANGWGGGTFELRLPDR